MRRCGSGSSGLRGARGKPCDIYCLLCYANVRGRENNRGHRGFRSPRMPPDLFREFHMKRIAAVGAHGKGKWDCIDKAFLKSYPHLAQFLCDGWWDDGKARDLGSISVRFSGSSVLLSITDHEVGATMNTTGQTLEECLELANTAIEAGTCSFRPWKKK